MAEIDMQKKQGGAGWIGWVVGLLVLVLLVWWIWPDDETEELAVVDTTEVVEPAAEIPTPQAPEMQALPATEMLANPDAYVGQTISGVAEVVEVPTDRAFWLDAGGGERLLAILDEAGDEVPVHVQQGQRVNITNAMVRGAGDIEEVSGSLDQATRDMLQNAQVFITLDDADITMQPLMDDAAGMEAGTGTGTMDAGDTGGY